MQTQVRVKNLRECRFFFMYIKDKVLKSASIVFDINNPDIALSERIINKTLERFYPDAPDRALFIREMELILSTTVLPEKYFSWLNDDKRQLTGFGVIYVITLILMTRLIKKLTQLIIQDGMNWQS
ncbi:Uncharacterised protein [Klebsiella michiganensis]|uniref:Uncharacterized protein n=1 Tax=Klebsiella michiganensis TaxID=1134687 RepID=A0A7H4M127_9ENTR|nr:Uncharacterised protein [Klebsiella michiganensis]